MKVLQVNKLYSPWIGGVETAVQEIAEGLNGADGISVTNLVCQPKGGRRSDMENGVRTWRARSWGMKAGMPISIDFFVLFRTLVKDADVVILHHPFPLAFMAYRLFGRKRKVMVWYHSDIVRQKISKIPFIPSIQYTLKRADHIIVSTNALIQSSAMLKGLAAKCTVIAFGVDTARFAANTEIRKEAEDIRTKYGTPLVLSVGRLVYYKGMSYLIRAMRDVPAKLLIVGSGPLGCELREEIRALGLTERVHIIDPVENLIPYYHACDVFALPSCEPAETFGVVQIEALACGKPVINTNLASGVPEVSIDGVTGRTVPPGDAAGIANALCDLLSDEAEYRRLSGNALREVEERFTKRVFISTVRRIMLSMMPRTATF